MAPQLMAVGPGGTAQCPRAAACPSAGNRKPQSNKGPACSWASEQAWPHAPLNCISPAGTTDDTGTVTGSLSVSTSFPVSVQNVGRSPFPASVGTAPPSGADTFPLRLLAHLPVGGETGNSVSMGGWPGGPREQRRSRGSPGLPGLRSRGPGPHGDGGKQSQCASLPRPHGHQQANSHTP